MGMLEMAVRTLTPLRNLKSNDARQAWLIIRISAPEQKFTHVS